ncbi:MAG: cell division protein ZapA [Gemmatimonadetes bacterium]|nr:MAG: cell division protein ZapA [Gemmatimonadota bacterium]
MTTEDQTKTVKVHIFGSEYGIKGDVDPDHIGKVARYVDSKMREITDNLSIASSARVAILAAINIADELYQERELRQRLLLEIEGKLNGLSETLTRTIQDEEGQPQSESNTDED